MAKYDYRCPACGTVFEVEHPMSEHPEVHCPECGELAEHVFSASAITFTGSGFYNTDQRGGSKSTEATSAPKSEPTSSSTGSDSSSSTKAESKSSGAE